MGQFVVWQASLFTVESAAVTKGRVVCGEWCVYRRRWQHVVVAIQLFDEVVRVELSYEAQGNIGRTDANNPAVFTVTPHLTRLSKSAASGSTCRLTSDIKSIYRA